MSNHYIPKGFLFPYVRFFNAYENKQSFDFYYGNSLVAAGIPFGAFSSYIKVNNGVQNFKITMCGSKNEVVASISLSIDVGEVFTLCSYESRNGVSILSINEPTPKENQQYGHLRICNLAQYCTCADFYAENECIISDIKYLDVSKYLAIVPGKYNLKLTNCHNKSTLLDYPSQIMKSGKYNSLYVTGSSKNPVGILSVDAASYSGFYL